MNIHEYQAKNLLKEFGAPVPKGVVVFEINELDKKIKSLRTLKLAIKAQIHAGGRGKAGGIKLVGSKEEIVKESTKMLGTTLVTPQTGPKGKKVHRLYLEEVSEIKKEFYLSCLVDRNSSKIAFISSTEGGTNIEKVAKEKPDKIITTKFNYANEVSNENFLKIISIFNFSDEQKLEAKKIINAMYNILITKDASLIEINPLIINKSNHLCCLDAKINFDDNALFRNQEILK